MNLTPLSSRHDYRRTPIATTPRKHAQEVRTNLAVIAPFDVLTSALGIQVARRWPKPCEAAFEYILCQSPSELVVLINDGDLHPSDLTFAAEILGRCADSVLVRAALLPLLQHEAAVVREGAVYGLAKHRNEETNKHLRLVASSDSSPGVQTAARDALNE